MSELKPCPFCGGDAGLHHDYSSESGDWYVIDCLNYGCMRSERSAWEGQQVSTGWRKTESEATEAWNTRAEHTCQMKKARWDDGQCTWGAICSACSHKHEHEFEYSFNFCPACGAKVVDDE